MTIEVVEVSESSSLNVRQIVKGSYEFILNNFSSLQQQHVTGIPIESKEFLVAGKPWTLSFYPNGNDNNDIGYASLFVSLKGESTNHVRLLYDLYLLDQSGKENHHGYSFINNPPPVLPRIHYGHRTGFSKFIKLDKLQQFYLKDDCLKISCNIAIIGSNIQNLPVMKVPKSDIATHFGKLLESKKWADVLFNVSGESFFAHKCFLVNVAPVFRSLLQNITKDDVVVVPDIEPGIFKAVLWFIYTGVLLEEESEDFNDSSPLTFTSFIGKMFAAADRFELERLKNACVSHVLGRLSADSVPYVLHLAHLYHATELKDVCLTFAAENKTAVMESEGSEYLKETSPLLFLELAGYSEQPSTSIKREGDFSSKIASIVKELFLGASWPWKVTDSKHKRKEF